MTYEEFKRELLLNLLQDGESIDRDVMLLEKATNREESGLAERTWVERKNIDYLKLSEQNTNPMKVQDDYLCVQWTGNNEGLYQHWKVHSLYENYKKEGWQSVLPVVRGYSTTEKGKDKECVHGDADYEVFRNRLFLRPQNYHKHREELSESIYWRFGDMAMVVYLCVEDTPEQPMMKLSCSMIKEWNATKDKILTDAMLNSFAKMPPRLFPAGDIRFHYAYGDGLFMPEEKGEKIMLSPENAEEGMRGYRLTTVTRENGALAIFYPRVKEQLAKLLRGDYYVGFISVHEAVIHPVRFKNPNEMKAAIQHINTIFDEKEMLTNKVYRYWSKEKKMIEIQ